MLSLMIHVQFLLSLTEFGAVFLLDMMMLTSSSSTLVQLM